MKSLFNYINEKLVINKNIKLNHIKFKPNDGNELRQIVMNKYDENPKYLDCTDIDVSAIEELGEYKDVRWTGVFQDLIGVEIIDVTGWQTEQVTCITALCENCQKLQQIIGLDTWDTHNIDALGSAFENCKELYKCDVKDWKFDSDRVWATDAFKNCPRRIIPAWYKKYK